MSLSKTSDFSESERGARDAGAQGGPREEVVQELYGVFRSALL